MQCVKAESFLGIGDFLKKLFQTMKLVQFIKKEVKSVSLILVSSQVLLLVVVARFFMVVSEFEDS